MSIIERAAELLRSRPEGQQSRPAAASEKAEMRRLDLIERASADVMERTSRPTDGEPPLEPVKTKAPGRSSSRAARQFAVDRNRLRALGLITPDGERTPLAESFRRIKRQILANIAKPKPGAPPANLVVVTSALAGRRQDVLRDQSCHQHGSGTGPYGAARRRRRGQAERPPGARLERRRWIDGSTARSLMSIWETCCGRRTSAG